MEQKSNEKELLSYTNTNNLSCNLATICLNNILIISVKAEHSTINEILGYNVDYNDDIYIFEIEGKTQKSPKITWKIYKSNQQIKELFDEVKNELIRNKFADKDIINKCQLIQNYTDGEIFRNLGQISNDIIYIYNTTNPNQPISLKEGLKISKISFSNNDEIKLFEGYAYKRGEPMIMRSKFRHLLKPIKKLIYKGWKKRWIILKNDLITYLKNSDSTIGKNIYWFDEEFVVSPKKDLILKLKNLSRTLMLKFDSKFERDLWKKEIGIRVEIKKNEIISNNLYQSFAPQKIKCDAKWFVDGESYFLYLLEQLKKAKESVYITDWFMSPEIALKRPINYDDFIDEKKDYKKNLNFSNVSRLIDILYLLANKGVKINILLFREIKFALALNSSYTKKILDNLQKY